jgi:hypothetical protein
VPLHREHVAHVGLEAVASFAHRFLHLMLLTSRTSRPGSKTFFPSISSTHPFGSICS